jgi:hypothetical protein
MLRDLLYISILTGGAAIFTATETLELPEAFLVSGVLSVVVRLLLERKNRGTPALNYFLLLICVYGFWFKVPVMLEGRLNYYLTKAIALVIIGIFAMVIFLVERKRLATINARRPRKAARTVR